MIKADDLSPEVGNLDNLIEQFPTFALAPNGIKQLRRLILSLAVRGKLVDHGSEEADILLKEIEANRPIDANKTLRLLTDNFDKPFLVPMHWKWTRLAEVARFEVGRTPARGNSQYWTDTSGYRWVSIADMTHGETLSDTKEFISELAVAEAFKRPPSPKGTLLMSFKLTIGKMVILGQDAYHNEAIVSLYPYHDDLKHFLFRCTEALDLRGGSKEAIKGNTLNRESIANIALPLPPLEEQKRIVAKVDELMSLVDKLEAQQKAQANTVLQANGAAINLLLNTSEEESFDESWNRVATHFNTLYGCTLPLPKGEGRQKKHLIGLENVKTLRRAILQLGVMGRFTSDWRSQFAKQHSVKSLLDKIQIQKQQLIDAKLIKKQKEYPSIKEEEKFYGVPDSWEWVRIRDFSSHYVDCPHDTPKYIDAGYPCIRAPDITENGLSLGKIRYVDEDEYIKRIRRLRPVKNDLVYIREGGRLGIAGLIKTDEQVCLGQRVMMLRFAEEISSKYMCFFLNAPITFSNILGKTLGAASPHVNVRDIIAHPVPMPPLEEQTQIVAKVDELMRICDKLEEQLTEAYSDAEALMQATVKSLVA